MTPVSNGGRCPLCDGSGKISYVEREAEDTRRELGHGLYAGPATTYGSRLCECRKNLARREGEATWWTTETVWSRELELPSGPREVTIDVTCEVPISEDNYPLLRDEPNAYWPALVEFGGASFITEDVRAFAAALLEAADKADELDAPILTARGLA